MKSPVEFNIFLLKFFCNVTCFDEKRLWKACKGGLLILWKNSLTDRPLPQRIFTLQEQGEREALKHLKHVIEICHF